MELDLEGLPESLGTRKCYYCQAEPESGNNFWEIFIVYFGEHKSVPCCDECIKEYVKGGTVEPPSEDL